MTVGRFVIAPGQGEVQQFLSQTDQMDTLILGSLVIGSQEENVTLSMHRDDGE